MAGKETLREAIESSPILRQYLKDHPEYGEPEYVQLQLGFKLREDEIANHIYRTGPNLFVHVLSDDKGMRHYLSVAPTMPPEQLKLYEKIRDTLLQNAFYAKHNPINTAEFDKELDKLFDNQTKVSDNPVMKLFEEKVLNKIAVADPAVRENLRYFMKRDLVRLGPLDPAFQDTFLEEISGNGTNNVWIYHKIFGPLESNVHFESEHGLQKYIYHITELLDRPATDSHPIIDVAFPDGSRANILYGTDISKRGTSYTLRKFSSTPVSVTQLVNWNTMGADEAAYLWLGLENNLSLFMCGETASGKTTTLNALTAFINPTAKVYTVEDTPEVNLPHKNWQRSITLEGKLGMFHLLKLALECRPNFVIVGEFRDQEGAVAFQAMQAGYPVMATFHAGHITTLVQRLTGDPIFIPKDFLANLNLVVFQAPVTINNRVVRRIININEIEGYSIHSNSVITRNTFVWEANRDFHSFRGMFNSFAMDSIVAKRMKVKDREEVYKEIEKRGKIISAMVENKIFNYYDTFDVFQKYRTGGVEALPFNI